MSLLQLAGACIGIVGSLFFAIGVMRQTVEAMARLAGTYWDWNPHLPHALAAQKADYLFGGGFIVVAFVFQLGSFFASSEPLLSPSLSQFTPWFAGFLTFIAFCLLRLAAARLAKHYESQITAWLKQQRPRR
ncbi:MAG: hypothetical protein GJU74_05555 [Metallibacterium scheffleri]|nr:hypothetical protein [Metallibacterium scheffleri]